RIDFQIVEDARTRDVKEGTVKRGSATCPCCGFTTPVKAVREQLKRRAGGASDARLICVVTTRPNAQGSYYRLPRECDLDAVAKATKELAAREKKHAGKLSLVPNEPLDVRGIRHSWAMIYGLDTWGKLFTRRQLLSITTVCRLVNEAGKQIS